MPSGIYLDNSMTTRVSEKTVSQMIPFFTEYFGHPTAPHYLGQQLTPYLTSSYRSIYKLLGANENDTFVFTSSGAEAVNHLIFSAFEDITRPTGKNQYLTSAIDEAPPIMSIGRLEQLSCVGKMIEVESSGRVTVEKVIEAITPRTALISLGWASGLTGVINPVQEISKICQEGE